MNVAPSTGAHVWLVDDSQLALDAARRSLEPHYDVRTFGDGPALLEALAQGERPDLVIVDWEMPEMTGLEICRYVRLEQSAGDLPIMILTGSADALVEGLDAGANDYVAKPFRPEELRTRVSTLVGLQRAHRKLLRAEQQLRDEADFRERFIGILAHDLRQPLNSIILATHILASAEKAATGGGPAQRARRAATRMNRMVGDLLDFTRSRAGGGMPVKRATGELIDIVRRVIDDRDDASSIVLEVEGSTHGAWDADRIAQICGNLLGNAREHGAPGEPVHVRVLGSPTEVALEIQNAGPAIPAADVGALFAPFRRGSIGRPSSEPPSTRPPGTATHEGLGLGLYIVDQIVRAHGGSMSVRSGEESTTFVARFPRTT